MRLILIASIAGLAGPAAAEIIDVQQHGMEIRHQARIAASAPKVWETLIVPARWWSGDHSFSGSSENITIEPRVGGCWCEKLPNGGGVVHMHVDYIAPPSSLVMRGALGPFYNLGADGALSFALVEKDGATDVTLTFRAGGYVREGFQKWAQPVDNVLSQQLANLKQRLEQPQ